MVAKAGLSGVPVLVLDPSRAKWEGVDFCTADAEEFIEMAFNNTHCLLIIDEAGEAIGQARSHAERHRISLATRTRHKGHNAIFISQYASTVAAGVRRQCQRLWTFRQSVDDCKILAREFCNEGIAKASDLPKWHYLYATTYGDTFTASVLEFDRAPKPPLKFPVRA